MLMVWTASPLWIHLKNNTLSHRRCRRAFPHRAFPVGRQVNHT